MCAAFFLFAGKIAGTLCRSEVIQEMMNQNLLRSFRENFFWLTGMQDGEFDGRTYLIQRQMEEILPIYGYLRESQMEDVLMTKEKREKQQKPEKGTGSEPEGNGQELIGEKQEPEKGTGIEQQGNGQELIGEKRELEKGTGSEPEGNGQELIGEKQEAEKGTGSEPEGNGQELIGEQQEPEADSEDSSAFFIPRTTPVQEIDYEKLRDFDTLVRNYYTIDGSTSAGKEDLDIERFLSADLTIKKNPNVPQILIYHTHSQEAYADSEPGDETASVMGMGERLAQILSDTYGFGVLHHCGTYDVVSRDYAYTDALPEVKKILEENSTIEVVIDLHRDAVPEQTRLVMDVDGRPTARFMFFNGMGRLKNVGNVSYLYNENLQDNLALSFQMQMMSERYYPGLARRIYLKGYRYNMHLKPKSMLIELGAQNNTVEEALNACDIIAFLLNKVLCGEE